MYVGFRIILLCYENHLLLWRLEFLVCSRKDVCVKSYRSLLTKLWLQMLLSYRNLSGNSYRTRPASGGRLKVFEWKEFKAFARSYFVVLVVKTF